MSRAAHQAWIGLAVSLVGLGCTSRVEPPPPDRATPDPVVIEQIPLVTAYSARIAHEGVSVDVAIQPLAAGRTKLTAYESARFRFTVQDTATDAALAGIYPAGWMHPRPVKNGVIQAAPDAAGCTKLIEGFISGNIFSQPEVDLNTYTVVVLNDDASINVVDPRFSFGGSKLLTMIPLGGPGYDWALRQDQSELFVSIPDAGDVTFIETYDYQPTAHVHIGEAAGRLRLQADEQYLWAVGGERLVAVDLDKRTVAMTSTIGAGAHDLAISADSRYVFVSDAAANTVSVIDTRTLSVLGVVETGWGPASMDWSSMGGVLYVAERGEGRISAIDPAAPGGPSIVAQLPAEAGLGELRFAPGGRFGLVVNPDQNLLHIFDAASGQVLKTGEVGTGPDHVSFSTELAYIRHAGTDTIYMIHLDELGQQGTPLQIVDFPAGQASLGPRSTPAASIIRAPGESAVLVAHPVDRAIYYYKEGMAAPMGQFSNYSRSARAVLTVDRSLKEVENRGIYETAARLGPPGTYDLAFFMDTPRVVHCFEVEVEPNYERDRELGPAVEAVWTALPDEPQLLGVAVDLDVRLLARKTGQALVGLDDVVFTLASLTQENWHGTARAVETKDGHYHFAFVPLAVGPHLLRVSTEKGGLAVEDSPVAQFTVFAKPEPATEPATEPPGETTMEPVP